MESFYRRFLADFGVLRILGSMKADGEYPTFLAFMAEYDELKCQNKCLRAENEELRRMVFRLDEDLPGEEWRDIEGYEGLYQVSNMGRIKSLCKGLPKVLRLSKSAEGYLRVSLHDGCKGVRFVAVQRLVAQEFIPNPDGKPFVNHIDGNKENNFVKNLEWVTQSENVLHAYRTGLSKGPNRRLTDEQVRYIRENPCGLTDAEMAKMFKVSVGTVRHARVGINYKYVK